LEGLVDRLPARIVLDLSSEQVSREAGRHIWRRREGLAVWPYRQGKGLAVRSNGHWHWLAIGPDRHRERLAIRP
jgi:hypothetical protein